MKKIHIKRYVSLLLSFVLLFGTVTVSSAAEFNNPAEYQSSDEYRFVKAFDLMPICNYDDLQPEKNLTRAEFAVILCKIMNLSPTKGGNEFVDISDNEYYEYICAVNQAGVMVGFNKYTFAPEQEITLNEAIKTIIVILGYEVKASVSGGYPSGYMAVANSLKLLSGIQTSAAAAVTRGDIMRIIYNARDVVLLEPTMFGKNVVYDYNDRTFLSYYLGVENVKGVLTDNGVTTLRGDESLEGSGIAIDGVTYKVDSILPTMKYIGHYVDAYHTCDDNAPAQTIVYIQLDSKMEEEIISFDITEFGGIDGRRIEYYSNNKSRTIDLSSTANIVYNGKAVKELTEDMFDYDYGTVTYIPAEDENADTIIIEGFVTWYIASLDRQLGVIRATTASEIIDGKYQMEIKEDEIGKTIFIEDAYGLPGTFADITIYSVLDICKNDDIMHIKIALADIQDKKISAMEKKNNETHIVFEDNTKVRVSPFYANSSDFSGVSIGAIYYVYKNTFGDIAMLSLAANSSLKVGYLMGAYSSDNLTPERKVYILTTDKEYKVFDVAEEIKYSDSLNNTGRKDFDDIAASLRAYSGIVNYSLNKEGLVNQIYLPVNIGVEREVGRLGCVFDGKAGYYAAGRTNWGDNFVLAADTPMFRVYEQEELEEDRYQCGATNSFTGLYSDSNNPITKAYNYEPNSLYAEYVQQNLNQPKQEGGDFSGGSIYVITAIDEKEYYKDEVMTKVEVSKLPKGEKQVFYAYDEDITDVIDTMYVTDTHEDRWTLKKGDIVDIRAKASDGALIDEARLWWRADMDNPYNANARRGWIPGNLGYYDATQKAISNPYKKFLAGTGYPFTDSTMAKRVTFGYVYHTAQNGAMTVTTQDLSCNAYDPNYDAEKYKTIAILPRNSIFGVITFDGDDIIVKQGQVSDIRSYTVDEEDCSRFIMQQDNGNQDFVVIINGEMEAED